MSVLVLVVDDEPDVEALFRQQFRRDLRAQRKLHEAAAAGRQEQRAREAGESAQISVDTFGARLSALKDRDAYKDHEKLALRRSQLEADKTRLGQDQQKLAKARANVDSLQRGTGSVFALLPPENATGNFVKVVQRVPVKIVFDDPREALRWISPGMSVEAEVRFRR